ncbi:MAG: hypothetical protein U5K69_28585 [Balneolaceae bacterium]|nr:hypothetical protein [Balneolaceae bacterium]
MVAGAIRSLETGSDKEVHPEKAVLYNQFIEIWYAGEGENKAKNLLELEPHMLLWAGERVLNKYLELHKLIQRGSIRINIISQALNRYW